VGLDSDPGFCGFQGALGRAYNEAAFRYFLSIERKRAERSVRPILVVLVSLRRGSGVAVSFNDHTSAAVFSALAVCLREMDFVGWYREGVVAAAVLALCGDASRDVRHRLFDRVVGELKQRLSDEQIAFMRVRVVAVGRHGRD
jgi:hypothetical protein